MNDDIDEARDWQGREIDCAACEHDSMRVEGRCRLKHACVNDRYARRIDRFFNWNPQLADAYIAHPHFEVRAIAASLVERSLALGRFDDLAARGVVLEDSREGTRWRRG